jgi:glycosyltransferase involved in cell wall biosynthesis
MTKRVAVIFDEDIYCQRGMFNAIRNRIKHLKDIADFDIDVYVIGRYEPWYIRKLRHTPKVEKVNSIELDNIKYNTLWYSFSLIDYLLEVKFHKAPIFTKLFYHRLANKIHGYDLISAHSTNCGLVALRISERDGIPFCVTWHGSDIHTSPFVNSLERVKVESILNSASCNFFVSDKLRNVGLTIAPHMKHKLLYNGRNKMFVKYSGDERKRLRGKYKVSEGVKTVAFVGNLLGVKNPQLLAPIFSAVNNLYDKELIFWVIGSGKMQEEVEKDCAQRGVACTFWGNQPADKMPEFMNCIDVLILPSRNEGLPLVVVEAIACGANVVGSDVGGIAEAIGKENVFPHGENFIDKISKRIVYMLNHNVEQTLSPDFEWENTAQKELDIYKKLI